MYTFNNFFLEAIIGYVGITCKKTYQIVSLKKKIIKVLQKLF